MLCPPPALLINPGSTTNDDSTIVTVITPIVGKSIYRFVILACYRYDWCYDQTSKVSPSHAERPWLDPHAPRGGRERTHAPSDGHGAEKTRSSVQIHGHGCPRLVVTSYNSYHGH